MQAKMVHTNFNVFDLEKSLAFYKQALGFMEVKRTVAKDGSFIIVFLGDGISDYRLELTWMRDQERPYELGDNEIHLAVRVDDRPAAYELHKKMGCVCFENKEMNLYFINDPDGYWIEILQA